MKCFCFENELETVRNRQKSRAARAPPRRARAASCVRVKVEMATSHTEVVQLLAARPRARSARAHVVSRARREGVTSLEGRPCKGKNVIQDIAAALPETA